MICLFSARRQEAVVTTFSRSLPALSGGNFVHLMDPEGNKIELWEPVGVEAAPAGMVTTK